MNLYHNHGKGQNRYPVTPIQGIYLIRVTDTDNNVLLYLGQVKGERVSEWTTERDRAIRFNQMGHQNTTQVLLDSLMKIYKHSLEELKTIVSGMYPHITKFKLSSYSVSENRTHQTLLIEI